MGIMIKEVLKNPYIIICLIAAIIILLLTWGLTLGQKQASPKRKVSKGKQKKIKTNLVIGNAQIIGTREKQDDSFGTATTAYGTLSIVADGIGGFVGGNIASAIAVEVYLSEYHLRDIRDHIGYFFQSTAHLANDEIRREFQEVKSGTTVVATYIKENDLYWTSIGDSTISLFRDGRIIRINRKENVDNWLEEQYYAGQLSKEEITANPYGKRLTNYVGYDGFIKEESDMKPIKLKKGDYVLLYSDGIEVLSEIELENILNRYHRPQKAADMIVKAVSEKKTKQKDNATIIIIQIK